MFRFITIVIIAFLSACGELTRGNPEGTRFVPRAGSTLELSVFESKVMASQVELAVILPPGFDHARSERYPLFIQLHGGGGDRNQLSMSQPWIDEMFAEGTLAPVVFVMFSSSPFSGFLGPWEELISNELPDWMAVRFNTRTDREGIVIAGISMGGYGALKSAFRSPERFAAVGAMEPSVEPTLTTLPNFTRNTWSRGPAPSLDESDNPARLAHDNADAIRASGLAIYLEVGDEDYINLHDGTEFVHRVLWDHDVRHEYHLVRWADHVGASGATRYKEMLGFLDTALAGGRQDSVELPITEEEQRLFETAAENVAAGRPTPKMNAYLLGRRGPTVHAFVWKPLKDGSKDDPDFSRAYARLPATSVAEKGD